MIDTTAVKWAVSSMPGAPTLNGTAGSMIAVLDACLVSGFVFGVPALVMLMQHWPGVFEAGMQLAAMAAVPSIAGFFIITGCVLVVCSIPGPWIVAGVFLWLKRSEGQTITEMADQLRGDIAGHGAAGRKGGVE